MSSLFSSALEVASRRLLSAARTTGAKLVVRTLRAVYRRQGPVGAMSWIEPLELPDRLLLVQDLIVLTTADALARPESEEWLLEECRALTALLVTTPLRATTPTASRAPEASVD